MNKVIFLFVFLLALTALSFAINKEKPTVEVSSPVISGSPILVLNQ